MPTLTTPDGRPVDVDPAEVNREFSRAMADDGDGAKNPPRHEAAPAEQPKRPRGRPRKDAAEAARVAETAAEAPAGKVDKDLTDECVGLSTLGWATLAAIPPTSPWACVIEANQDDLVKAL